MTDALRIDYNVPAKLRDGTTLYANVFRPAEPGKYPIALTRTPYGKDYMTGFPYMDIVRLAKSGYIVIVQDVRGRGASEGVFQLFVNEAEDGYDSVEWAANLDSANGKVGMWGFSYMSYTQWAAALMNPPSLKAIAPTFTLADFTNGVYWRGGALELGLIVHLLINSLGMEDLFKKYAGDPSRLSSAINTFVEEVDKIPYGGLNAFDLKELDVIQHTGIGVETLNFLLDNYLGEIFSSYPYNLKKKLADVKIPALNIAGWNDIFLQDTIDCFNIHQQNGSPSQLLIGPWSHLNYSSTIGEMDYGMSAPITFINKEYDHVALIQRWFDRWLKNDNGSLHNELPVKVFIGGENSWIEEDQWPPQAMHPTPFYMHESGMLSTHIPEESGARKSYEYDPQDPFPTHGGSILMHPYFISGPRDQRLLHAREDMLYFQTDILDETVRVIGPIEVKIWASSSAVDTDFVATLLDIHPDGKVFNLTDGIIRAKFRESNQPQWIKPGEIYPYAIDLWSIGHAFLKGHRIALRITSSNFPRWDRNLNNDGKPKKPRVASQTIYMDAGYPSRVLLPVIPE